MSSLARRPWVPPTSQDLVQHVATQAAASASDVLAARIDELVRARRLRRAGSLTSGIGLPVPPGDLNGLRMGTPELVRWGVTPDHTDELAALMRGV